MTDVIRKDLRRLLRLRVRTQLYDRGVLSLGSTVKGWSHVWALQDYLSMVNQTVCISMCRYIHD